MKIMRSDEVATTLGVSRRHVERLAKTASDFPKRVALGERAFGFLEVDVNAFLLRRAGRPEAA